MDVAEEGDDIVEPLDLSAVNISISALSFQVHLFLYSLRRDKIHCIQMVGSRREGQELAKSEPE